MGGEMMNIHDYFDVSQLPEECEYVHSYNFESEDDPAAIFRKNIHNHLVDKLLNNEDVYIKYIAGDRKGSIAKLKGNTKDFGERAFKHAFIKQNYYYNRNNISFNIENYVIYGIATWNNRRNTAKISLPFPDVVFLPHYNGPTVYCMFDKNAAKAEILANPDQYDIDGNLLTIGDEVLYTNIRYGNATELCHGKIQEFKAVVDSRKTEIFTIIAENGKDN